MNYPEQVRAFGDFVYVCDMANRRICKINSVTKELTEYLKFEEPTWEYGKFQGMEIIKLDSGMFAL